RAAGSPGSFQKAERSKNGRGRSKTRQDIVKYGCRSLDRRNLASDFCRQRQCQSGSDRRLKCRMQLVVEAEIICPHCGEAFSLQIDTSEAEQSLVEDCSICCRPINLIARCRPGEIDSLAVSS